MTPRNPASATQDVRGAILSEATRVFKEHGLDGVTMRQVAEAIGYSATTIYLHFKNKDELLLAVCVSGFAEFGATIAHAASAYSDPREQLRAAGRAYVDFALANPMHYDVMFIRPKEFTWDDNGEEPESYLAMVGMIEHAMESGALRQQDSRVAALQIWSALHGPVALGFSMSNQIPGLDAQAVRHAAAALLDACLDSLA